MSPQPLALPVSGVSMRYGWLDWIFRSRFLHLSIVLHVLLVLFVRWLTTHEPAAMEESFPPFDDVVIVCCESPVPSGSSNSVVVVVDFPASIASPEAKSVCGMLERHAVDVIRELDARESFALVASSGGIGIHQSNPNSLLPDETTRAVDWLKQLNPVAVSRSEPSHAGFFGRGVEAALAAAFELHPRQIIFISASQFTSSESDRILDRVRALQIKLPLAIAIDVRAIDSDGPESFLRELAKQNGSDYRIVNP